MPITYISSGRLRLESISTEKFAKERSARPRARAQRVHAGARVAPSPVALIIEQICVVSDICRRFWSRNKDLQRHVADVEDLSSANGARHFIMLRTARLTSGTRARSMRYACAMAPLMLWLLAHGMPPRCKTPIVCTLCVAMRYRSLYT